MEKNVAYNSKDRHLPTVTTHDTVIRVREEIRYTKVFVPVTGNEFLHFSPLSLLLFHHLSSPLPRLPFRRPCKVEEVRFSLVLLAAYRLSLSRPLVSLIRLHSPDFSNVASIYFLFPLHPKPSSTNSILSL